MKKYILVIFLLFTWKTEHAGCAAVRYRNWKLVKVDKGEWELYDFTIDRTESENLIERYPGRAEMMKKAYHQWALENQVYLQVSP